MRSGNSGIAFSEIHAGVHRRVFGAHRLLGRVFPFAVYYDVLNDTVNVKAMLDCRRNPQWIEKKLRGPH